MADSDDEYDKKFRDKFRGERDRPDSIKGFDNRRDERRPPRDDWIERFVFEVLPVTTNNLVLIMSYFYRDPWAARPRGRGDFRNIMRERHSPVRHDSGPPMKRMRNEW